MQAVSGSFQALQAGEIGADFDLLQKKWEQAEGSGSTSKKMLDMLERYAAYLNSCAQNYETAESNARIRASSI